MKYLALSLLSFLFINVSQAQTTEGFSFDGQAREYILYVPASYDGTTPYPLVISLHGLGDNMNNFSNAGFHQVSDTGHFIVATPQALVDPVLSSTAWNSNASQFGYVLNANVDDVGFISALIDTISANYNVNSQRVYATGFSMGGFMTNRLACELNTKIAAFASVAGTIGASQNCVPGRAVSFCHFHGTNDATVPDVGNPYGMDAQQTVDFWVNNNMCNTTPDSTNLPDIASDSITVTNYLYDGGNMGTEVEFYRAYNAAHQWLYTPVNDILYPYEIWKFFNKHQLPAGVGVDELEQIKWKMFPNPSSDGRIRFEFPSDNWEVKIYDINGKLMFRDLLNSQDETDLELPAGSYTIRATKSGQMVQDKLVIIR